MMLHVGDVLIQNASQAYGLVVPDGARYLQLLGRNAPDDVRQVQVV